MAVKPLSQLLAEADRFIKTGQHSKTASQAAPVRDEVADFAEQLMSADAISTPAAPDTQHGVEKLALALNRAEALLEIQALQKIAQFEERALTEGYAPEQVEEVIEKIAARNLHGALPKIVHSGLALPTEDEDE